MLATLVRVPLLTAPLVSDDYSLIAGVERSGSRPAPLMNTKDNLWVFYDGVPAHTAAAIARGALPWWTAPQAKLALWRPLSSLVITTVHAGAGWRPLPYHVAAVLAFLLAIAAAAAVLPRLVPRPVAVLAVLLFSLHSVNVQSSNWMSALHLPLSTALALFALLAYIRSREDGWRSGNLLSLLLLAAALSAGEVALSVVPFFVAYELSVSPRRVGWDRALAPTAMLAAAYIGLYALLGFGARGIAHYAAPTDAGYWRADRLLAAALQLFAQVPGWIAGQLSGRGRLALSLFLAACPVTLAAALRRNRGGRMNRLALYWSAALIAAALPAIGGPSNRGLFLASVAASTVVALLLTAGVRIWRREQNLARQLALTVALVGTAAAHLAGALITTAVSVRQFQFAGTTELAKYRAIRPGAPASTDVLLLNADDEASAVWGGVICNVAGSGEVRSWRALSLFGGPMSMRRTAANAFELSALSGAFDMDSYRDTRRLPFHPGDVVAMDGLTVEVRKVENGTPAAIAVVLDRPLDDGSLYVIARTPEGFRPVTLPPVGGTIRVGKD